MASIDDLQRIANEGIERYRSARRQVRAERTALENYKAAHEAAQEAAAILQTVAAALQHKAHEQVATVVTRCLQTVFPGKGYTFRINFLRKRGKTDASMVFVKNGVEIDPTSADSGGVTQVAAFGLRLACLLLALPHRRKLLVLDEPFNAVSREYVPTLAETLKVLSKELDVQIILVTHNEDLHVGKVIKIGG